jgi:putative acetyltransferase
MNIRTERASDITTISNLHYAAFKDHPQHPPGAQPIEHLIVERLRACGDLTLSLVAEEDSAVTGHIAISPATVGDNARGWFLLGPVGVLPHRQGQGIGSALVREAADRMRRHGAAGIVLVGDPGFYTRLGFKNYPGLTYAGVPPQYVLAVQLRDAAPCGEIIAHAAFSPDAA